VVGAGLGTAGAILQAVTRNPLAEPGILGINSGASVAAVLVILFIPKASEAAISLAAFLGAGFVCLLLFSMVPRRRISGLPLLLTGVAISSLLMAITQILFLINSIYSLAQLDYFRNLAWLMGGFVGWVTWQQLWMVLPWLVVLLPWSLIKARDLNLLALGPEPSVGLGMRLERQTALLMATSAAICAACVAVAGPVSFLGLIAPNAARFLLGSWQPRVLPAALMIGGFLMVTADLASHAIAPWWDIPCGLLIAVCGGPFLLVGIMRSRKRGRDGR
jgi:iron complex transport system permease protein